MIDIVKLFDELNQEHFEGKITKIPVKWNSRMRTTAGYCKFKKRSEIFTPIRIELSKKLFQNENWDKEKIKRTLIHEMVHAYLLEFHNERGHTSRFQSMMTMITGEYKNHRCHNYNVEGLRNEKNVVATCPRCGVVGKRSRLPNARLVYKCSKCKSKISWTKTLKIKKSAASNSATFKPLF